MYISRRSTIERIYDTSLPSTRKSKRKKYARTPHGAHALLDDMNHDLTKRGGLVSMVSHPHTRVHIHPPPFGYTLQRSADRATMPGDDLGPRARVVGAHDPLAISSRSGSATIRWTSKGWSSGKRMKTKGRPRCALMRLWRTAEDDAAGAAPQPWSRVWRVQLAWDSLHVEDTSFRWQERGCAARAPRRIPLQARFRVDTMHVRDVGEDRRACNVGVPPRRGHRSFRSKVRGRVVQSNFLLQIVSSSAFIMSYAAAPLYAFPHLSAEERPGQSRPSVPLDRSRGPRPRRAP